MHTIHDWKFIYNSIHTTIIDKHGKRSLFVLYVKCTNCGQIGFKLNNRKVVYTWKQ